MLSLSPPSAKRCLTGGSCRLFKAFVQNKINKLLGEMKKMHLTPMKGKRWCLNFQVGPSLILLAAVHVKSKDWFIALRRLGLGLLRRLGCPVKVWRVGVKGWLWCCGGSCREDRGRKRGMGRTQGEFFLISFSSWHLSQEDFSARSKKIELPLWR